MTHIADMKARLMALLALALCAGCTAPRGGSGESASASDDTLDDRAAALASYSRAVVAGMDGDPETAFDHFREAAENDPGNEELQLRVALGDLQKKDFSAAESRVRAYLAEPPASERSQLMLGLILRVRKDIDGALEVYRRALKDHPRSPVVRLEYASTLATLDRADEAIDLLDKGIEKADEPGGQMQLAYALAELTVRRGAKRFEAGETVEVDDAIVRLTTLLETHPDDVGLLLNLGDLHILKREVEAAVGYFVRAEEADPDNSRIRRKLTMSLLSFGDRQKAVEALEAILADTPGNLRVYYYLGDIYEQMGESEKAIETYERASLADPSATRPYIKQAYALLAESEYERAVVMLEKARSPTDDDPSILEMLAYMHLANEDYEPAGTAFRLAVDVYEQEDRQPMLSNFKLNHAIAEAMTGHPDTAAEILRGTVPDDDEQVEGFLAFAMRQDGENQTRCLEVFDRIADVLPDTFQVRLYAALLHHYAMRYETALTYFEKAESTPENPDEDERLDATFYFWYGAAAERAKQYDLAETLFLTAIRKQPDFADAHNYLAYMHAERGVKLEDAFDHVQVALAVEPDNPAYIDTLGWTYYQMGRYEDARIEITRAQELLPEDPTILEHLGDVLLKLGRVKEAVDAWVTCLDMNPENADALQAKIEEHRPALHEGNNPSPESVDRDR